MDQLLQSLYEAVAQNLEVRGRGRFGGVLAACHTATPARPRGLSSTVGQFVDAKLGEAPGLDGWARRTWAWGDKRAPEAPDELPDLNGTAGPSLTCVSPGRSAAQGQGRQQAKSITEEWVKAKGALQQAA